MSGHSKWSTIKRQKGKTDAQRGKLFTKIGREIAVAVKAGGADPVTNAKLRDIITKARSHNMPNDNITRSIKKASGELGSVNYEVIIYEGYGPSGMAVIVECLTDNKNRTAGDVRHIFDKAGGSMGTTGCVGYLFDSRGIITVEKTAKMDDDEMMMLAIDCGADDFAAEDGIYQIVTDPNSMESVRSSLEEKGIIIADSQSGKFPQTIITLDDAALIKAQKMLDSFDDNDDVQQVYHNAQLPDEDEDE